MKTNYFKIGGVMAALMIGGGGATVIVAEPAGGWGTEARTVAARVSQEREEDRSSATIRGRIEGFRHIRPGDDGERAGRDEHTLVNVRMRDGRSVVIALGPKTDLDRLDLRKFDHIMARGRAEIVEGVPVLVADRIEVNGEQLAIQAADRRGGRTERETTERARPQRDAAESERPQRPARADGETARPQRTKPKAEQTERAGKKPVMDANARELFEKVRAAYRDVKALRLAGVFATDVAVDGVTMQSSRSFTSSYQEPNRFRHETADMLTGSDGQQAFVFNKKANSFMKTSLEGNQQLHETLPASAVALLHTQDPSLLGAMMHRPFQRVLEAADRVEKIDDGVINGRRYPQLVLRGVPDHGPISILIDPQTHLARRITVDMRRVVDAKTEEERARRARVVVDYTMIDTSPEFEAAQFAWQPVTGAQDVAQESQEDAKASESLLGKAAPEFELSTMDGKKVSMRDLEGKVVMLDFWANWCPPCADSLPKLGEIYREQDPSKVAFYAIHVGDKKQDVRSFMEMHNVRVPVLFDADGSVAKAYHVRGVPKTVIVGMDGKVLRVFTGLGGDRYDRIRDVLTQASGQPRASRGAGTETEGTARAEGARERGSRSREARERERISSAEAVARGAERGRETRDTQAGTPREDAASAGEDATPVGNTRPGADGNQPSSGEGARTRPRSEEAREP